MLPNLLNSPTVVSKEVVATICVSSKNLSFILVELPSISSSPLVSFVVAITEVFLLKSKEAVSCYYQFKVLSRINL